MHDRNSSSHRPPTACCGDTDLQEAQHRYKEQEQWEGGWTDPVPCWTVLDRSRWYCCWRPGQTLPTQSTGGEGRTRSVWRWEARNYMSLEVLIMVKLYLQSWGLRRCCYLAGVMSYNLPCPPLTFQVWLQRHSSAEQRTEEAYWNAQKVWFKACLSSESWVRNSTLAVESLWSNSLSCKRTGTSLGSGTASSDSYNKGG